MNLPPRHSLLRSLVLWGGLLVMGFIVWAWCDSAGRWSYLHCGPFIAGNQDSGFSVYHQQGSRFSLRVGWTKAVIPVYPGIPTRSLRPRFACPGYAKGGKTAAEMREIESAGTLHGQTMDPLLLDFCRGVRSPMESLLVIPHWCVLLAALLPWLGLIYWRYRRIRGSRRALDGKRGEAV